MNKNTVTSSVLTFVVIFSSIAANFTGLQTDTANAAADPLCEYTDGIRVELLWGDVEDNLDPPAPVAEFDGMVSITDGSLEFEDTIFWDGHDILGTTTEDGIDWEADVYHHIDGLSFYAYSDLGEDTVISVSTSQFTEESYSFDELRAGIDIDLGDLNFTISTEEIVDERICDAGTITLYKDAVTDDGASFIADDFHPTIDAIDYAWEETVDLFVGDYTIGEEEISPLTDLYDASIDCTDDWIVSLSADEDLVCTITNDDIAVAPEVTITKVVDNDAGGTAVVEDFALFIEDGADNETEFLSGETHEVSIGPATVYETGDMTDYEASFSGDCDENGEFTALMDESYSCTITNTYDDGGSGDKDPTRITVTVNVINDDGGTMTESDTTMELWLEEEGEGDFSLAALSLIASFSGSASGTSTDVNPGTFDILPSSHTSYTRSESGTCDGSIADEESLNCTITFDDVASNGGSGGGSGGGTFPIPNSDPVDDGPEPIVLGDTDEQPPAQEEALLPSTPTEPAPEPIVLGETHELPRTGAPTALMGIASLLGMAFVGRRRK